LITPMPATRAAVILKLGDRALNGLFMVAV
jgi:hypothetical protein